MMKKKTNLKNLLLLLWLLIFQILCLNATKHTYKDLQSCEECEENSKIFYEIKNIKICPRCTLSYLSHRFQEHELKIIQFYVTDVVLHYSNEKPGAQNIRWTSVNKTVGKWLQMGVQTLAKKTLKSCKNLESYENLTLNLICIANKILLAIYPTISLNCLIKEKKCKNCTEIINHPIKTLCCKEFVCLNCLADNQLKYGKCMICGKYLYRNKTQFQQLLKQLCLTHWKIDSVEIKNKQKILENVIEKLVMPNRQIKENMLNKEAMRIVSKVDIEVMRTKVKSKCAKLSFPSYRKKNTIYFASIAFQMGIIVNFGYGWLLSSTCAIVNNFFPITIIGLKYIFFNSHPTLQKFFGHHDQMDVILEEIEKLSLSWLNLFVGLYFEDNRFFEHPIYVTIYFFRYTLQIHWLLFIIVLIIKFIYKVEKL